MGRKIKKETVHISRLIEKLTEMKEENGDIKIYVVANDQDDLLPGTQIQFWGLSDSMSLALEASTEEKMLLVFRSDEILQP